MGKGGGASNRAQAGVVNKKAKSGPSHMTDEDIAFKKQQAEEQKKLKEAAAKLKKK